MRIAPVTDVKARLSTYLGMCADGPVIVTKNGRPTAVLVAVSDEEELERLVLGYTPRFRAMLDAAERRIRRGGGVGHAEFWSSLGKESGAPRPPRAGRPGARSRKVRGGNKSGRAQSVAAGRTLDA